MKIINAIMICSLLLLISCAVNQEVKKFTPTSDCKSCEELLTNRFKIIDSNILVSNSNFCFDYYCRIGDCSLININSTDSIRPNIQNSIYYYKNALLIDSNNQEGLFKIAYSYDFIDSINKAKFYYNKINQSFLNLANRYNQKEYSEINVDKIKQYFNFNDSIITIFKNNGKSSSIIFDQEYDYSHAHNSNILYDLFDMILPKLSYLVIYGNGEFEVKDNFSEKFNNNIYFEGKLPENELNNLLRILSDIRFLTFQNLLGIDGEELNCFVYKFVNNPLIADNNVKTYSRITIKTSQFKHSVSVYGLIPQPWDNEKIPILNNYKTKLDKLSKLWLSVFNDGLLKYKK